MPGDTAGGLLLSGLLVVPHDPVATALRQLGLAADAPSNAATRHHRLVEPAPAARSRGADESAAAALLAALGRHADGGLAGTSAERTGRMASPGQADDAGRDPARELAQDELAGLLAFWDTFAPHAHRKGGIGDPGGVSRHVTGAAHGTNPASPPHRPAGAGGRAPATARPRSGSGAVLPLVVPHRHGHPRRLLIRADGSGGGSDLGWSGGFSLSWSMNAISNPTLTQPANQVNAEGDAVNLPVQASDPNHYPLTFDAVGLPPGLTINSGTGVISGTIAYNAYEEFGGDYTPTVAVVNGHGGSNFAQFNWTVNDTPLPPTVTNPGNQSSAVGQPVSLPINATDPDGYALTYTATGLPAGLSIDYVSGVISGAATGAAASPTPYAVTVTADDGSGNSASQSFTWAVTGTNQAPQLTSPGNQTNAAGDTVSLDVSATDADGDTLTYTASGLPAGLSIDPSSGTIAGTIANSAASTTAYSTTVTASDGVASSSQTFSWTVNYVGVTSPGNQTNVNGDAVSLPITAVDAQGLTLSYSATGLPPGLTINSTSGTIAGTIGNTADGGSPYTTVVTASDGTYQGSQTLTWTVAHLSLTSPGDQFGQEGSAVALPLQAADSDGDHLTYSATGLPSGLTLNGSTGLISGTLASPAHAHSPYAVTLTASDGTHSSSQAVVWTVTPRVVLQPIAPQGNADSDTVSLPVTASEAGGATLTYSAANLPPGLGINSSTGLISGTIGSTADSGSPYLATVTASDGTYSTSQTVPWTVSPVYLVPPVNQTSIDGDSISLALMARDHDGDTLSYSASNLPPGLSINASTGAITGTLGPTADGGSPYTVVVTASDGANSSNQSFAWRISQPISFTDPGNQENGAGAVVSLPVPASDSDGDTLTYSATGLPTGLTISGSTGTISGTIAHGAESGSPYTVVVTASDGTYSNTDTISWTVTHVALANPGTQTSTDGTTVSLALQGGDADGDTVTFSAAGLPSGLSINSSTGVISGTLPSNASSGSAYVVTVSASDGTNTTSQVFLWQVVHVGVTAPANQTGTESNSVSLQVQATDGSGASLTYSAGNLPPGLSINPSTGLISGSISADDAAGSPYTVTVAATDGTVSNSQSFTWTVNPHVNLTAINDQTNAEGDGILLPVQASDPDGDTLGYSATGLPPGLLIDSSTGIIGGTVNAGDAASSPYLVTVTAGDGTYSNTVGFNWNITPSTNQVPTLTNPGTQDNATGEEVNLQLQAADADGDPLTFSATGLPDGLNLDPSSGIISGTVADDAASATPYSVQVTVDDPSGSTATQTFSWLVTPAPLYAQGAPVSAVEGVDTGTITVATFTTPDLTSTADEFTAQVTWSDGSADVADVTGGTGTFTVTDERTFAETGTYTGTVWISADDGAEASAASTATVADAALNLTGGYKFGADVGQATAITVATFTDGNLNGPGSDYYTATINWGDGSSPYQGNIVVGADGLASIMGNHSYAQEGTYTPSVTLTDEDGAMASGSSTVVVGGLYAGIEATFQVPSFSDAVPSTPPSAFSATITWGDGTHTGYQVTGGSGIYALAGPVTHTYATDSADQSNGAYPWTVTVYDSDGNTLTGNWPVPVERPEPVLAVGTVSSGLSSLTVSNLEVADFTDVDTLDTPSEFSATIDWGDGYVTGGSIAGGSGLFQVFGTHTYATAGFYVLTVTLDQGWQNQAPAAKAAGGGQAGKIEDMITIPKFINADDTPKQMTDLKEYRIPPSKTYEFKYSFGNIPKTQYPFLIKSFTLGNPSSSGAAGFLSPTAKKPVNVWQINQGGPGALRLLGGSSTAPTDVEKAPPTLKVKAGGGNAGDLFIGVWDKTSDHRYKVTEGFSVAAIPLDAKVHYIGETDLTTGFWGILVSVEWQSDSSDPADLNAVYKSEQVEMKVSEGLFTTTVPSSYLKKPASDFPIDLHTVRTRSVAEAVKKEIPSWIYVEQVWVFHDYRTGAMDIPMPNSGYLIVKSIDDKTGKWVYKITENGASATANNFQSNAGATNPANGIVKEW